LVYAACPGIDIPYEFFTQKNATIVGTNSLSAGSKYGYCLNVPTGQNKSGLTTPFSHKLTSMTDKYTLFVIVRPNQLVNYYKYIFASFYSATWTSPYYNFSLLSGVGPGKIGVGTSTSSSSYQYNEFTTTSLLPTNEYSIIAVTRNVGSYNLWRNGKWLETLAATSSDPISWGTGVTGIGINPPLKSTCWLGDIICTYAWNRVLSHAEISLISAFPFILFDDGRKQEHAFFVADPVPVAPVCITPTSASDPQVDPTPFQWTAPAGATGYRLQVATDAGFTALVHDDATLVTNSASVVGLAAEGAFFWRVLASNGAGVSPWSATETFTRASNIELIYPGNGTTVAHQPVYFAWAA